MAEGINLTIYKTGATEGQDISGLVKSIKWEGRRGNPARSITVTLLDDDGYGHARPPIQVEDGWHCIFRYDGVELFRGIFMSQTSSDKKTGDFKAYDNGIYLSNNRDTFAYEKKRADEVFTDVCKRFGLPTDQVAKTSYVIPDLTKKRSTGWDAIEDALSLEYDNTNTRYYVFSDKGKLSLKKRIDNVLQWVMEAGTNISSYKYSDSIEKVRTRIKLLSDKGKVVAEAKDAEMEKLIGIMQEIDTPDESLNSGQVNSLAKSMLKEKKRPAKKLTLSKALGLSEVISGVALFVIIPHLEISRTLYVEQDSHLFQDNLHTMNLQLSYVSDAGENQEEEQQSGSTSKSSYKKGDIVDFKGGYHYVSSDAGSPVGGWRSAGKAKITYTAPGAKHPYSLVGGAYNGVGGSSNVYGWVDAGTFS